MVRALWIWPLLAVIFAGLVAAGIAHGPWNYYWFIAMGCDVVMSIYWSLAARAAKQNNPPALHRFRKWVLVVFDMIYFLPLSSVPLLGQRILPRFVAVEILGAFMCAFGVGFAIWARRALAGNWNPAATLREHHTLVRTGPYAVVRHPIYLGCLVKFLGMFLVLGEVRAFVCFWPFEIVLRRILAEERILREAYPKEYADYARRVKRLVPCIW
jgi:protein-S-isoprenylcysteine O-methyltransferase Ste14